MPIRVSPGRVLALAGAVAGAAAVAGGCAMATLPDQGPVRPAALVFSLEPENATAGAPLQPAVGVTVLESNGDTAFYSTATIQLSIAGASGKSGAHLGGITQAVPTNGTAFFFSLTIDSAGVGYQLQAYAPALDLVAFSDPFDVVAGAPARLVFTVQPVATPAGDTISPAVRVAVQDTIGNTVLPSTASVTLAIGANPGPGVLGGITVRQADSGVATFPGLSVSAPGAGYTLVATSAGLAPDTSAAFTITTKARLGELRVARRRAGRHSN